ncbi:MAG: hypothetical protein HKO70_00660 [Acidimicrobiia bacterium]|nr:hypothetical protein [Acidimicrobiia bacterium]
MLGLLAPLAAAIALDWLWVRQGEPYALEVLIGLMSAVVLGLTPWLVFRALRFAWTKLGLVGTTLLAALLSLFWYFIAFVVFMNFHMAFGGAH